MKPSLSTEIAGLSLSNPTILASGVLGTSGALMRKVAESGAGAIVAKSVGSKPREGCPNPTVAMVVGGYLNAIGLPNPGVDEFVKEILMAREGGVPIIASVFGFSVDDIAKTAKRVGRVADAVELNLSCPHVEGTGLEVGSDPEVVSSIIKEVKKVVDKPVIAKLSPLVADIVGMARSCERAGADAITAVNTMRAMAIDIETKMPVLYNRVGGLSGPALKPIALRCVYEIYDAVRIPVMGCGGISTWRDAVEFVLAGARAVQIGTGIAYRGLKIFDEVQEGMRSYMEKREFEELEELVGLAHSR